MKKWYRFSDEFMIFLNKLVTETFGTKNNLAECMQKCLKAGNIKTSRVVCMYDTSYGGCTGDRLKVYKIAFKSMGFEGNIV